MIRYFLGVIVAFVLTAALWGGLFVKSLGIYQTPADRRLGAWYKIKREAVQAKSDHPKILLVGASNVLYGLRAATLEERFRVPSVNFGTHAAMAFSYLVDTWKRSLKPGDLVVMSIEWRFLVRGTQTSNDVFVGYLLGGDPAYFRKLALPRQLGIVFGAPLSRLLLPLWMSMLDNNHIQQVFQQWTLAYEIAPNGDFFGNTFETRKNDIIAGIYNAPTSNIVDTPDLDLATGDTQFWRMLTKFLEWCKKNRIKVVYTAPSVLDRPEFSTPPFRKFFAAAEARYESLGVPVLVRQKDNFYPQDMMYNTVYHLNDRGATERTAKLIPLLAPAVKQQFSQP